MANDYKKFCSLIFTASPSRVFLNYANGKGCKFGYKGFKIMCRKCKNCYMEDMCNGTADS